MVGCRTLVGALVPPGWLSGLEDRRSSVLEFCRWNSDVEGETAEGEGRVGGAAPPGAGAGAGAGLCWGFRPREVGPGEGDGEGEGEGEGGTVLGGWATGGPPGVGCIMCGAGGACGPCGPMAVGCCGALGGTLAPGAAGYIVGGWG